MVSESSMCFPFCLVLQTTPEYIIASFPGFIWLTMLSFNSFHLLDVPVQSHSQSPWSSHMYQGSGQLLLSSTYHHYPTEIHQTICEHNHEGFFLYRSHIWNSFLLLPFVCLVLHSKIQNTSFLVFKIFYGFPSISELISSFVLNISLLSPWVFFLYCLVSLFFRIHQNTSLLVFQLSHDNANFWTSLTCTRRVNSSYI